MVQDKNSVEDSIDDEKLLQKDKPVYLSLYYIIFFINLYYLYCYILNPKNLDSISLTQMLHNLLKFDYLLIPYFFLYGFLVLMLKLLYGKLRFLEYISIGLFKLYLFSSFSAFLLLFLGFGGWGNLKIYSYFPFSFILSIFSSVASKYTIFSIFFILLWTLFFLIFPKKYFGKMDKYKYINFKSYIFLVFTSIIFIVSIFWNNIEATILIISTILLISKICFDINSQKLNIIRLINTLFIVLILWPVLYKCITKSTVLFNFAYI